MGIVWEAYHKGVPLLGVRENPTECSRDFFFLGISWNPNHRRCGTLLRKDGMNEGMNIVGLILLMVRSKSGKLTS